MALRKAGLPVAFAGGVETEEDAKQVPSTQLLDLQNAVFTRKSTISKRNGYRALSQAIEGGVTTYSDPKALAARGGELLVFAGGHAYSHRPDADRWSDAGEVRAVVASDEPIARSGTTQTVPDLATSGGVTLAAWEDSRGGVWYSLVEAATGRVLVEATQASATGYVPRCVAVGDSLHLYWAEPALAQLWIIVVNPAEPTQAVTGAVLIGDLSGVNFYYDAVRSDQTGEAAAIAWCASSGSWHAGYVHPSGVMGSPVTGLPSVYTDAEACSGPIAITHVMVGSTPLLIVLWANGTTMRVASLSAASAISPITLTARANAFTATGTWMRCTLQVDADGVYAYLAAELQGSSDDINVTYATQLTVAGLAVAGDFPIRGHGLMTRAWRDADTAYVTLGHGVQFFPYAAVVSLTATGVGTVVARLLPGTLVGLPQRKHLSSVEVDESDERVWTLPLPERVQLSSEDPDQWGETGIRRASLDFDAPAAYQTAQLGRGLYLAAAAPQHYDGSRWAEWGYHTAPDTQNGIELSPDAGGSLTPSSTYSYIAWYEETDAQGEIHASGTSIPVDIELGVAEDLVQLFVPTLRLTGRGHVRVVVARCVANDPSNFYVVTSLDPSQTVGNNRYLQNDTTVDTLTLFDGLSDDELRTRPFAYTDGGVLSNDPAPCSGAIIAGGKNRLFWTDPGNPNVVRYSQELLDGNAVEAPADLSLPVDPFGGPITGLAVLDDTVIVFKESAVYVFGGPGPQAAPAVEPQAFAFTPAQLVTSDAGCSSQDSIGYTPLGVVFQSSKGLLLLTRERQLVRVGDPVNEWASQRVRSATLLPDRTQVLFVCDDEDGRALLYDYKREQWSTFTNHVGLDGLVIGGVYHYLRADGRVFVETPGEYADDNAQIRMRLVTAWIKLAGYLQGWQRVYHASFLGRYISPHTLRVAWRLDYEAGFGAPQDLDVDENFDPSVYGAGLYGAGYYGHSPAGSTVYQRTIHIGERCQAICFSVEDVEATDARGASFELSELLLTGGVLGPAFKLGEARSN